MAENNVYNLLYARLHELEDKTITVESLAADMRIPVRRAYWLLKGELHISPTNAVILAERFGITPLKILTAQSKDDLAKVQTKVLAKLHNKR